MNIRDALYNVRDVVRHFDTQQPCLVVRGNVAEIRIDNPHGRRAMRAWAYSVAQDGDQASARIVLDLVGRGDA